MNVVPLMALTTASQVLLDQAVNIGYSYRDSVRQRTMPESRRADNLFRYFYMSLWTPLVFELSFRLVEKYFTAPALTHLLELNKLGYQELPLSLRYKMLGGLTKANSFKHIPDMLMRDKDPKTQALAEHLRERLDFKGYLKSLYPNNPERVQEIEDIISKHAPDAEREIRQHIKGGKNKIAGLVDEALTRPYENEALRSIESKLTSENIKELVLKGMKSRRVEKAMALIKKSDSWPKMGLVLALNFLSYGVTANLIDIKVIQPWQEKMVAKRGTVKDVEHPTFMALIPGIAILASLMYLLRKRGYIMQVAVSGVTALVAYTAIALTGIKKVLSHPPKNPPADQKPSAEKPVTTPVAAPQFQQQIPQAPQMPQIPLIPPMMQQRFPTPNPWAVPVNRPTPVLTN